MWSLLKKLTSVSHEFGIGFADVRRLLGDLAAFPPPPKFTEEKEVRKWFQLVLGTLVGFAEITPSKVNDDILKLIDDSVGNDTVWPLVYRLLGTLRSRDSNLREISSVYYGNGGDMVATALEIGYAKDIVSACDKGLGKIEDVVDVIEQSKYEPIDPAVIVTLISGLYEFYDMHKGISDPVREKVPKPIRVAGSSDLAGKMLNTLLPKKSET